MARETTGTRLAQLRRGTEGAAASLPPEHSGLAARAAEAAARLATAATALERALDPGAGPAAGDGDGPSARGGAHRLAAGVDQARVRAALRETVSRVEALHFGLLKVKVHGAEPVAAGVPERVEEALERAAALEAMLQAPPAAGEEEAGTAGR